MNTKPSSYYALWKLDGWESKAMLEQTNELENSPKLEKTQSRLNDDFLEKI